MRIAFFSFLLIVLATFYLYGYWRTFGIDPFPYLGPDQIVLHSLGALCGGVFTLLIGAGIGAITKRGPSKGKFEKYFMAVVGCLIGLAGFFYGIYSVFVLGALWLLGIFASYPLANSESFKFLSKKPYYRQKLIFIFFIGPPLAHYLGFAHTLLRSDPRSGQKVVWVANSDYEKLIGTLYLGRMGDSDVFLSKETGLTFILPDSKFGGIGLLKSNTEMPPSSPSGD